MSAKFLWRGPLAAAFCEKTQWKKCGDSAIAETVPGESAAAAKRAGVCDLSPLPRFGAAGECSDSAPPLNAAAISEDGGIVCRLGEDEILVLASPAGKTAAAKQYMPAPRLLIPRRDSHCQIGVRGARAADVLARLCAAPPPEFPALLQTRAAETAALIIPEPRIAAGAFYILADSGYAAHVWEAVCETALRLDGCIHGRKLWAPRAEK